MPDPLTTALQRLTAAGLPVPPATAAALRRRLQDFTGILDEDIKDAVLPIDIDYYAQEVEKLCLGIA